MQLRVELGIADHVWQEKRDAIAQTVDALGNEFKPAMRAGWMAHIRKTCPVGAAAAEDAIGEGTLVVGDDWVRDAHGLFASLFPVVDVPIGLFFESAMNMHPNHIFRNLK